MSNLWIRHKSDSILMNGPVTLLKLWTRELEFNRLSPPGDYKLLRIFIMTSQQIHSVVSLCRVFYC